MRSPLLWAWITLSAIIVIGFFFVTYMLMFYPVVVAHDQEWEYIKIGFGALATIFVQIASGWITWFAASYTNRGQPPGGVETSPKQSLENS